jgi:CRISPR-associated endonuclease/helicase Cas3
MIDSGCVAAALMNSWHFSPITELLAKQLNIKKDDLISYISYVTALHDIGKCHPAFQENSNNMEIYSFLAENALLMAYKPHDAFRHEHYTSLIIKRIFSNKGRATPKTTKYIKTILDMHHQGKQGIGYDVIGDESKKQWWHTAQDEIEERIYSIFIPSKVIIEDSRHIDAICMLIMGIVILSDWISSGRWFENDSSGTDYEGYLKATMEKSEHVIEECGFTAGDMLPSQDGFCGLWHNIAHDKLRPLQKSVQDIYGQVMSNPMLMIIEAPMGEGKTEAGIYAAACMARQNGKNGLYIALPSAATSNQMFTRVSELLNSNNLKKARLLHSMAWILDTALTEKSFNTEDKENVAAWMAPLRRGLLTQYAVGTVDQAMMAALKAKYGVLRLLGLSTKVLIIDEIHAYDAYMSEIIIRLLQWCKALDIPVVLLSATLPLEKKRSLVAAYGGGSLGSGLYPLITTVEHNGKTDEIAVPGTYINKRISIQLSPTLGKWEKVASIAVEKVKDGGCLCIIVNTVNEAQTLFGLIKGLKDHDLWLRLFHARFVAKQRNEIENQCITAFGKCGKQTRRPERAILVATQVAEQSLDLDFDEMISAIAPIDLLLQRSGRMHRHDGRLRPQAMSAAKLTVLIPDKIGSYGPTESIYPPLLLDRTIRCISEKSFIDIPNDIRKVVDEVYDMNNVDDAEIEAWAKFKFDESLKRVASTDYELPKPNERTFCMAENVEGMFNDDESASGYLTAKTRLGEPSARVAFLPENFGSLSEIDMTDRDTAKDIMGFSVSLRKKLICTQPAEGFDQPIEGKGLLSGIYLYSLRSGEFKVEDKSISGYRIDNDLGVIIEKRQSNGKL